MNTHAKNVQNSRDPRELDLADLETAQGGTVTLEYLILMSVQPQRQRSASQRFPTEQHSFNFEPVK